MELIRIFRLNRVRMTIEFHLAEFPIDVHAELSSPGAEVADLGPVREGEGLNPPGTPFRIGERFKHLVREHVVRRIDELVVGGPVWRDRATEHILLGLHAKEDMTLVTERHGSVKRAKEKRTWVVRGITLELGWRAQAHVDSLGKEYVVDVTKAIACDRGPRMHEREDVPY